jgi:hypothetical protein
LEKIERSAFPFSFVKVYFFLEGSYIDAPSMGLFEVALSYNNSCPRTPKGRMNTKNKLNLLKNFIQYFG